MWVFSSIGYFSAVCAQNEDRTKMDPDKIMVRARCIDHLKALKDRFNLKEPILVSEHTDYCSRIILDKSKWTEIVSNLALDINYDNFKNECHKQPNSHDYCHALFEVWMAMDNFQRRNI